MMTIKMIVPVIKVIGLEIADPPLGGRGPPLKVAVEDCSKELPSWPQLRRAFPSLVTVIHEGEKNPIFEVDVDPGTSCICH